MGQEELAALLNNMAPDGGLCYSVSYEYDQAALDSLGPEERAVAVTLLGYPEHSIGRLMTDYIAVAQSWSIERIDPYSGTWAGVKPHHGVRHRCAGPSHRRYSYPFLAACSTHPHGVESDGQSVYRIKGDR